MKKQQNISLGILVCIILLFAIIFGVKYSQNPNQDIVVTWEEIENLTPIDKQKIISETFWENPEIEDIFALQDILWPEIVMEIDCDSITNEVAKTYCVQEKAFAIEFFARTTWGDVTGKWYEYAMSFDCADIFLEAGQKTCEEFQITSK